MKGLYQFVEWGASFTEAMLVLGVIYRIGQGRFHDKKRLLLYMVLCALLEMGLVTILNHLKAFSFVTIFLVAVFLATESYILCDMNLLTRLLAVVMAFFVLHTTDYIIGFTTALIVSHANSIYEGFDKIMQPGITRTVFTIINKSTQTICFFLFRSWYSRIREFDRNNKIRLLSILSIGYIVTSQLMYMIVSESPVVLQTAIIISWFFILIAALSLIVLVYRTKSYQEEKELAHLMQYQGEILEKNYHQLAIGYKKQRKMIHDFRNHLRMMDELAGNHPAVKEYILSAEKMIDETQKVSQSGNDYVDAIIHFIEEEAKESHILFTYETNMVRPLKMEPVDICAVLANLLENAVEACAKIEEADKRRIHLRISQKQEYTLIMVENTVVENSVHQNSFLVSSKKNKENHGIGMDNIRTTIDRYQGELQIEIHENSVICLISLQA